MKEKLFYQTVTQLWAQAPSGGLEIPFKKAVLRAVQNGRQKFKSIFQRTEVDVPRAFSVTEKITVAKPSFQNVMFNGLFPKVSFRTLASELRRRAALQGISGSFRHFGNKGGSRPLLCFIGVGLASTENFQTKSQDDICANIRDLVQKFDVPPSSWEKSSSSLQDLVFGSFIEKGCNAAVYEARYVDKDQQVQEVSTVSDSLSNTADVNLNLMEDNQTDSSDDSSTLTTEGYVNIQPFDLPAEPTVSDASDTRVGELGDTEHDEFTVLSMNTDDDTDEGCSAAIEDLKLEFIGRTEVKTDNHEGLYLVVDDGGSDIMVLDMDDEDFELMDEENPEIDKCPVYDLAVKMMFNYEAESNVISISQAMRRETVPARLSRLPNTDTVPFIREEDYTYLPPHPNIVDMKDVFIGNVPELPDATTKYPAALPQRLYDQGLGRNMTMFLVMKRYSCTLREYLGRGNIDITTRILLLAQLLEGIDHLVFHQIAHRDLKSNNILIDDNTPDGKPRLVISDFGCCLTDKENGLKIPFVSSEQPKGGNPSLMAPEIINATPNKNGRSVLDYSKSDLWAAGSLAYEIFGDVNPFYGKNGGVMLNSKSYRMIDLPPLPESVPGVIQQLIYNMLQIDPKKRIPASAASTVVQMYLWSPEKITLNQEKLNKDNFRNLILFLTLEVISEKLYQKTDRLETELKLTLLKRLTETDLDACVSFYLNNI